MTIENTMPETAKDSIRVIDAAARKVWSIMDAAHDKPAPSEYLKPDAIRAVQGK